MPIAKPDSAECTDTESLEWGIRTGGTWGTELERRRKRGRKHVLLRAFPHTSLSFWMETLGIPRTVMGCFGTDGFVGRCGVGRGFWPGDWYMTRLAFAKGEDQVN